MEDARRIASALFGRQRLVQTGRNVLGAIANEPDAFLHPGTAGPLADELRLLTWGNRTVATLAPVYAMRRNGDPGGPKFKTRGEEIESFYEDALRLYRRCENPVFIDLDRVEPGQKLDDLLRDTEHPARRELHIQELSEVVAQMLAHDRARDDYSVYEAYADCLALVESKLEREYPAATRPLQQRVWDDSFALSTRNTPLMPTQTIADKRSIAKALREGLIADIIREQHAFTPRELKDYQPPPTERTYATRASRDTQYRAILEEANALGDRRRNLTRSLTSLGAHKAHERSDFLALTTAAEPPQLDEILWVQVGKKHYGFPSTWLEDGTLFSSAIKDQGIEAWVQRAERAYQQPTLPKAIDIDLLAIRGTTASQFLAGDHKHHLAFVHLDPVHAAEVLGALHENLYGLNATSEYLDRFARHLPLTDIAAKPNENVMAPRALDAQNAYRMEI